MCYKHSVLEDLCLGSKGRARSARAKRLCSLPQKTCYKSQHNAGLIFHRENLSDVWHTSYVHLEGNWAAFYQVQICPLLSLLFSFLLLLGIRRKTLQSLNKHVLVLTSLLRSVTPQEPGGFTMRAIKTRVREQQEQAAQAQPCPQHGWGGATALS